MSIVSENWQDRRIFIVVKTYPTPSKKYQETVCTAGIDEHGNWVRLYPVRYRFLNDDQKYPKYTWIHAKICRNSPADFRPESYKVDEESIKQIEHVGTERKWIKRNKIVLQKKAPSVEFIKEQYSRDHTSLGIFHPSEVTDFLWEHDPDSARAQTNGYLDQYSLFDDKHPVALEPMPYRFSYRFQCDDLRCEGHKMIILDWEIYAAYFKWKPQYGEQDTLMRIRDKWLGQLCSSDRYPYFIIGTNLPHPTFMILGVHWPPKSQSVQYSLFD